MKRIPLMILVYSVVISCSHTLYKTNGETIYMTGKNVNGEKLLDRTASGIPFIASCKTCHGKGGDAMRSVSVKFSHLSDSNSHRVPYTESLFYRFLDQDLKSDGTKANIGVIWKMNDQDKKDLLDYLKNL